MKRKSPLRDVLALILSLALAASTGNSQIIEAPSVSSQVVAVTGDPAPDGNGQFAAIPGFDYPALGDNGRIAFRAHLTNTAQGNGDDSGIFVGDGSTLIQISREGMNAPVNGIFSNYNPAKVNDSGVATFEGFLRNTPGGTADDSGLFFGSGGAVTQMVRKGQPAPDNDGNFSGFNFYPGLNESGTIVFVGYFSGTANTTGIFSYASGVLTQVARTGQIAPGTGGTLGLQASPPAINNSGQLAFYAQINGSASNEAIIYANGGALSSIARVNDAAPDGDGVITSFASGAALNENGQVAFSAFLSSANYMGVFRIDGSTLTQIARTGEAAPDADGTLDYLGNPALNDSGQIAFHAFLEGTANDTGIFRRSGPSLLQIARKGQAAPDGNGVFDDFLTYDINSRGQVAFNGFLTGTATTEDEGIFIYDDTMGLIQIARRGDALLGSTITDLGFAGGVTFDSDERSGLNNLGQVAYHFILADGRSGVAIWGFFLTKAGSRKTHGSAGTFEIDLPLTGAPGVECRSAGANGDHTLVFVFTNNVVSGSASVSNGTGSVSGSPTFSSNTMAVNLTGVTNAQQITITLSGVTNTSAQTLPNISVPMRVLLGDTSGNSSVNSTDIGQTKSQVGAPVTASNARLDVNSNGSINSSDVGLVKLRSGMSISSVPPQNPKQQARGGY